MPTLPFGTAHLALEFAEEGRGTFVFRLTVLVFRSEIHERASIDLPHKRQAGRRSLCA